MLDTQQGALNRPESDPSATAMVLVGYQNEYFSADGTLRDIFDDTSIADRVLGSTVGLLDRLPSDVTVVTTPIAFTPTYDELIDPIGVLATIKDRGAFRQGSQGVRSATELDRFGQRIHTVASRRGFNAFSGTHLDEHLADRGITDVVLAGALTSLCVDSTGRAALDRGYRVTVLSDCTVDRSPFEQGFFCERIFPLYAGVITSAQLLVQLGLPAMP